MMGNPYTVQGTSTGPQLGGLSSFIDGAGLNNDTNINDPNAAAYDQLNQQQAANAGAYGQQAGAAQGRLGPTIANPYQGQSQANLAYDRGGLASALGQNQDIAAHGSALAQNQLQQGVDASIQAQSALANSSRGGAVDRAGALRSAQQNAGQQMANSASTAAQLQAQTQQQALQNEGGLASAMGNLDQSQYGLEQQNAQQQAALAQQQGQQNDAYSLGLYGLQQQAQGSQLQGLNGYNQAQNAADQLKSQQAQQNASTAGNILSGAVSGAGSLLGLSDARAKEDIHDGSSLADDFLRHVDPQAYKYRNPQQYGAGPGQRLGIMAQDLEQVRGVGPSMVQEGADGYKRVDLNATLSSALAGIGRLHERLEALEGKGKR